MIKLGSGGTEWETGDVLTETRLNQKTRFIGTGNQISNLITDPQVGQTVFSTESDSLVFPQIENSIFPKNKLIIRNSANDEWQTRHLNETEGVLGTGSIGATNGVPGQRYYDFFTLPTTEKFYIIYAIDTSVGNNDAVTQNITYQFGIDIVDADPPTINNTTLVGISSQYITTIFMGDMI